MGDDEKFLRKWELETSMLWKGVELDSVQDLLQDCPIKELKEGAVLIQAGQPNDSLYLILSGRLRIHLKELTLAPIVMLGPGEVVGEMSVFDRQPASAYVVAHEDSRLLVLDRATIWSLIEIYPIVARNLLFVLAQRLRSSNALVEVWLLERVSESEPEEFEPQEVQESEVLVEQEVEEEIEAEGISQEAFETGPEEFQPQEMQESPAPLEEEAEAERIRWEVPERGLEEFQPQEVQESEALVEEEAEVERIFPEVAETKPEEFQPQEVQESTAFVEEEIEAERIRQALAQTKREDAQSQQVRQNQVLGEEDIDAETISLYTIATAYVLESIRRAEQKKRPDIDKGKELVQRMSDSIVDTSGLLLLATDRRQDFAVSTHCVNVSVLSLRLSQTLGYLLQKQIEVGLAGLLHEIGVVRLPERMLQETGQVRAEARQRPVYGAEILRELCPEYDWLAQTVGQVYERENGSGFPQGLKGKDICEEAKILGIMDVFEACIHDRPHRKALTGYQLLSAFTRGETESFAAHIVKALIEGFSVYTYNEYVILNTQEMGRVVEVNSENLCRPLVRILYDKERKTLEKPIEIDLAKQPALFITKAVTYDELLSLAESESVQ